MAGTLSFCCFLFKELLNQINVLWNHKSKKIQLNSTHKGRVEALEPLDKGGVISREAWKYFKNIKPKCDLLLLMQNHRETSRRNTGKDRRNPDPWTAPPTSPDPLPPWTWKNCSSHLKTHSHPARCPLFLQQRAVCFQVFRANPSDTVL